MPTCSRTPRRASRWAWGWRRGLPSWSSSSRAGTRRNSRMRSRIVSLIGSLPSPQLPSGEHLLQVGQHGEQVRVKALCQSGHGGAVGVYRPSLTVSPGLLRRTVATTQGGGQGNLGLRLIPSDEQGHEFGAPVCNGLPQVRRVGTRESTIPQAVPVEEEP